MVNKVEEWAHPATLDELKQFEVVKSEEQVKSELCLKCMKCCTSIGFPVYKPLPATIEFFMTRGARMVDEPHDITLFVYKNICPQLDLLKGCKIYETRPKACRDFDGRKHNSMKEDCLWKTLK